MAITDKKGINVTSGFKLVSGQPLDARLIAVDETDLQSLVDNGAVYDGMIVWVQSLNKYMSYNGTEFKELATGGGSGGGTPAYVENETLFLGDVTTGGGSAGFQLKLVERLENEDGLNELNSDGNRSSYIHLINTLKPNTIYSITIFSGTYAESISELMPIGYDGVGEIRAVIPANDGTGYCGRWYYGNSNLCLYLDDEYLEYPLDPINKLEIYELTSSATSSEDNNGSGGSSSGSSGGNTEEYKTLTITLNSTDNVKDTIEDNDYYSLSDEQYNKLANLRCSEIKSIYFKSSNEYQDPETHVFYGETFYFTPTWSISEENVIGVTPEDEVYPKLMTIGGTHIDAGTHDAILFTVMLNPSFDERRFGIIPCIRKGFMSNVESFIDFCLNPDVEGTTAVLTLNIEYK